MTHCRGSTTAGGLCGDVFSHCHGDALDQSISPPIEVDSGAPASAVAQALGPGGAHGVDSGDSHGSGPAHALRRSLGRHVRPVGMAPRPPWLPARSDHHHRARRGLRGRRCARLLQGDVARRGAAQVAERAHHASRRVRHRSDCDGERNEGRGGRRAVDVPRRPLSLSWRDRAGLDQPGFLRRRRHAAGGDRQGRVPPGRIGLAPAGNDAARRR